MANNPQEFIPSFSSKDSEKNEKITPEVFPQCTSSSSVFMESFGSSTAQTKHVVDIEKAESHQHTKEYDPETIVDKENRCTDDKFTKILSRVTEGSSLSLETPDQKPTQKMNIESLLEEDSRCEPSIPELSNEDREEIYAEGFIAGSMEQKEIMDKRIEELKQTVLTLGDHDCITDNLSNQINESIGEFAQSLVEAIIGEAKQHLLADIVDNKVQEFINSIKAWDCKIYVHCSPDDFNNLTEIHNLPCGESSIKINKYVYMIDKDLSYGKFKLEINKEDSTTIEAIMDFDSHFNTVRESVNELI